MDSKIAPSPELEAASPPGPRLRVEVLQELPHDPEAFTQGLVWFEGKLLESTGQYGRSTIRRVEPTTGRVEQQILLPRGVFGEGLARVGDRLIQLTWREGMALVRRLDDLEEFDRLSYEGEGWGICHGGSRLFMSDGGAALQLRDPESFAVLGTLPVLFEGRPVGGLNELECAEGWVWANVYQTDMIAKIDPGTGDVVAVVDASGLLTAAERRESDVLNGIAYDPNEAVFYLTGKLWPKMFKVRFVDRPR